MKEKKQNKRVNENVSTTNLGRKEGMVQGWDEEQHGNDSTLLAKENILWEGRGGWERNKM